MSIETVVTIEPSSGTSAYSHMVRIRDLLVQWMADPVYQKFVAHERALEFFRHLPKATAAWAARIQFLRMYNPTYLSYLIQTVKGSVAFESALAKLAAEEAFVAHSARIAAANAAASAAKGTLVAGAGTTILAVVLPVVGMVAVQVALGSGYYEARQRAKKEGYASGFAKGFVAGLLKWELRFTIERFWDNAVANNPYDESIPRLYANAHNQALMDGRRAGLAKADEEKKDYLTGLRLLTNTSTAGWTPRSDDWMERARARQVQISYVIELAVAVRKHHIVDVEQP